MNKLFLIIKREYLSRVRKKSFIIMTLLTPLFMIGVFVVPILIASNSEDKITIAIIDNSKFNEFRLASNLNIEYTNLNEMNLEEYKTTLIETYDFLLHIPEIDSIQQIESSIEVYSTNQMSLSIKQNVENQIDKKLTNIYLLQSGINPDQIMKSQSKSKIKTYVVDEQGKNSKGNSEASFGIGLVGGFLIYIFIFMYGTMAVSYTHLRAHET